MGYELANALVDVGRFHFMQKDKNGKPILLHLLRVMLAVPEDLQIPAVLHDIVEDTSMTIERLQARGIDERDINIIEALTRRKGERYFDYIKRVKKNPQAVTIKLADMNDNLRPPCPVSLKGRYLKAALMLKEMRVIVG